MLHHLSAAAATVALAGALCVGCTARAPAPLSSAATTLARCLAKSGTTMYGAEWCSHCQRQQQLFGAAFTHVPYVECPKETQRCVTMGIARYPTWVLPDGTRREGVPGLAELGEATGCPFQP